METPPKQSLDGVLKIGGLRHPTLATKTKTSRRWGTRATTTRKLGHGERADGLLADGELIDEVGANFVAAPRNIRNEDFAGAHHCNIGLDDVVDEIASRSGDIAGQDKVLECG